jgi:hypothetical protein
MESMGDQQKVLLTRKMRQDEAKAVRRKAKIKKYIEESTYLGLGLFLALIITILMTYVSYDRRQRWPELEPAEVKRRQEQRKTEHLIWLQAQQERIQKEDRLYQEQNGDKE